MTPPRLFWRGSRARDGTRRTFTERSNLLDVIDEAAIHRLGTVATFEQIDARRTLGCIERSRKHGRNGCGEAAPDRLPCAGIGIEASDLTFECGELVGAVRH